MKRILALLLVACMVVSFAGCGKNKGGEGDIPTLTWLMFGDQQPDNAAVMEAVNKITVPAIGAKLNIQYIDSGAYDQRMQMNMASGNSDYDLCFTGYTNWYASAAKKGGLLDISEYVSSMPDLKNAIPETIWNSVKVNGKIYAVPNMQIMGNSSALNVRKDLADEYGLKIDEIEYIEDLEPFLEWVKTTHPEYYPFRTTAVLGKYKGWIEKEGLTTLISVTNENGKTVAKKNTDFEDFEAYPRLMSDWLKKGYIRKDNAVAGTNDSEDWKAGKYAAGIGTWKPSGAAEHFTNTGYEIYSKQMTRGRLSGQIGASTMIGINRTSKNPEKAIKLIEMINTDKDLYNLIIFGIKDKHYKLVDGKVQVMPENGYNTVKGWAYGNQFNAWIQVGQDENVWVDTQKFIDEATVFDTVGFVFDSTAVRTELAQVQAVNDKYNMMNKGVENIDEYITNFKKEQDMAGIDKVVAEVQKQLSEFQASNAK